VKTANAMNGKLEPSKFDRRLLPVVVAIIMIGLGALVREWRNAHTSAIPQNLYPPQNQGPQNQ